MGSVVAITDENGDLVSQQRYLPFGGIRTNVTTPNSPNTDYGYTGQRNLDEDLGLMDYKARFYSPVLNRFIQPDSIVPDPTNPQAWNRYSYVYNSPINYADPTGHLPCQSIYCSPIWQTGSSSSSSSSSGSLGSNGDDEEEEGSQGKGLSTLTPVEQTNSNPNCEFWGSEFSCKTYINPNINLDNYFAGARIAVRAGYFIASTVIGAGIGLYIGGQAAKLGPVPAGITAGVTALLSTIVVNGILNSTIVPYELEVINDLEVEFKEAQKTGQPLIIASTTDPVLRIPGGGNYVVDGTGGEGIYVNTWGANLTVHAYSWIVGLNMP